MSRLLITYYNMIAENLFHFSFPWAVRSKENIFVIKVFAEWIASQHMTSLNTVIIDHLKFLTAHLIFQWNNLYR